jgi:hypothetical protein
MGKLRLVSHTVKDETMQGFALGFSREEKVWRSSNARERGMGSEQRGGSSFIRADRRCMTDVGCSLTSTRARTR